MKEIDDVLVSMPDRAEAEKIILEKLAPLMDEVIKKSGEALKVWLDAIRKSSEREKKELDDIWKKI